jgi:hypothetical protein
MSQAKILLIALGTFVLSPLTPAPFDVFELNSASAAALPVTSHTDFLLRNARVAAEQRRPTDVLRLWFTHVASPSEKAAKAEGDLRSVLWWAVAHGGLCPGGLTADSAHIGAGKPAGGAGLWPVALHNFTVGSLSERRARGRDVPPPFEAFTRGRQARKVHHDDVLSASEIKSFTSAQGPCSARDYALALPFLRNSGEEYEGEKDRVLLARAMQLFLLKGLETLDARKVVGIPVIRARIFDLTLYLMDALGRSSSRREAQLEPLENRGADTRSTATDSFAREIAAWDLEDWLLLTPERRLFLWNLASPRFAKETPEVSRRESLVLPLLDAALSRRNGREVTAWIAHLDTIDSFSSPDSRKPLRRLVWSGERGQRLAALEPSNGFRERAIVLLHRGVEHIEAGRTREALRDLAQAIATSEESSTAETLRVQTRRWLTYVLGTYEVKDDVLSVLQETLPREDAAVVQEDLAWRAAFRADARSFESLTSDTRIRTAARRRLERVAPLSKGQGDAFVKKLDTDFNDDPQNTSRDLDAFLTRVEREDPEIRARIGKLLVDVRKVVTVARARLEKEEGGLRRARTLADLLLRLDALTQADDVRSLAPSASVFAGRIRATPEGDLPWPFLPPDTQPPTVFAPLILTPVDWRVTASDKNAELADDRGIVAGWRISE